MLECDSDVVDEYQRGFWLETRKRRLNYNFQALWENDISHFILRKDGWAVEVLRVFDDDLLCRSWDGSRRIVPEYPEQPIIVVRMRGNLEPSRAIF